MTRAATAPGRANALELRPSFVLRGAYGQPSAGSFLDDASVLVACGAYLHRIDAISGVARESVICAEPVRGIAVSGDGGTIVTDDASGKLAIRRPSMLENSDTIDDTRAFSKTAIDDAGTYAIAAVANIGVLIELARATTIVDLVGHKADMAQERGEYYDAAYVSAVAIAGNGTTAVTGSSDATAIVWDVPTGRMRSVLSGHDGTLRDVAIDRNAATIATIDSIGDLRTWDALTGRLLLQQRFRSPAIRACFARAANHLAVMLEDGTLAILARSDSLDYAYWQPVRTYALPAPYPYRLSLSFDSRDATLAVVTPRNVAQGSAWLDDSAVTLVTLASGEERDIRVSGTSLRSVAFDAAANRVLALSAAHPAMWDLDGEGEPERLATFPALLDARLSADGRRIAATAADRALCLYDRTGTLLTRLRDGMAPTDFAISHDGRRIAAVFDEREMPVRLEVFREDGTRAAAWDVEGGARIVGFDCDGAIVVASREAITSYDAADGEALWRVKRVVGDCALALRARRLFVSYSDDPVAMYDTSTGALLDRFLDGEHVVAQLAAHPDGGLFATSVYGEVRLWSVARKRVVAYATGLLDRNASLNWQFAPDGTRAVVSVGTKSDGGSATVFDLRDLPR